MYQPRWMDWALHAAVRDVRPVAVTDGEVLGKRELRRRVVRDGVGPVEGAHPLRNEPPTVPLLEAVDVAQGQDHVAVVSDVVGDAVRVDLRDVAGEADVRVGDEVV